MLTQRTSLTISNVTGKENRPNFRVGSPIMGLSIISSPLFLRVFTSLFDDVFPACLPYLSSAASTRILDISCRLCRLDEACCRIRFSLLWSTLARMSPVAGLSLLTRKAFRDGGSWLCLTLLGDGDLEVYAHSRRTR